MKKLILTSLIAISSLCVFAQAPNSAPTNELVCWSGFNGNDNDEKTDDKQQNNWTESDRKSFKADCKRGLEDSKSSLTQIQRTEYCDCILGKIESNYPNKYSQQNMEVMKRLAKSCLQGL